MKKSMKQIERLKLENFKKVFRQKVFGGGTCQPLTLKEVINRVPRPGLMEQVGGGGRKRLNTQRSGVLNYALFILVLSFMASCATFSKNAKYNAISSGSQYIEIANSQAKFKSLSYGDFVYASDKKNYKNNYKDFGSTHITPKKLVLFANTADPKYYYYIIENAPESAENPSDKVKTIHCQGKSLSMVVQGIAPKSDIAFLLANFKCAE